MIKPIAEQAIPLNRNAGHEAKLLRQINTHYLFDIEFGDQQRQSASDWVAALEATQFKSTIAQISLATARSCLPNSLVYLYQKSFEKIRSKP